MVGVLRLCQHVFPSVHPSPAWVSGDTEDGAHGGQGPDSALTQRGGVSTGPPVPASALSP